MQAKILYKYTCPFGDEHKFKDERNFVLHLVNVHYAEYTGATKTFVLRPTKDHIYKLEDYEIKEPEKSVIIVPEEAKDK